ncbi:hypothetical protein [Scytonema hofmannii]|uniref:hypothetical protein n=1 Tax=Scytonema hofmannii TaxID=34078 RepID=UPI000348BF41|nr:hypothetical protein [Scytonema hofmannii]
MKSPEQRRNILTPGLRNESAGKIDDFNNFLSDINNALKIVGSTIKAISPLI